MPDIEDVVSKALDQRVVPTTRILGGVGGAAVPVPALVSAVQRQLGERDDLEAEVDQAVKRLGGQRTNYADTAGFVWKLRRFFGQSSERPEDVYVLPERVVGPLWDEPS